MSGMRAGLAVTQNTVCKQAGASLDPNVQQPPLPFDTTQNTTAGTTGPWCMGQAFPLLAVKRGLRHRVCWSVALLLSTKKHASRAGAATATSASRVVCWLLVPVDYAVQVFGNAPAMLSAIPVLVATASFMSCRRYPTPRTKIAKWRQEPRNSRNSP